VKKSHVTKAARLENVFYIKRISRSGCRAKSKHEDW